MKRLGLVFLSLITTATANAVEVDMSNTEQFILKDSENDTINEVRACLEYKTEKACNFREVCTATCIGTAALAGFYWAGPVTVTASAIFSNYCGNLCHRVEDCHDVQTCVRWSF